MTKHKNKDNNPETKDINNQQSTDQQQAQSTGDSPEADKVTEQANQSDDNSAKLAEEAQQWKDKYLRLSAEFDNYRKRTLKEKMEIIAAGGEDVIKSVLGVVDDMDRAVVAMENTEDMDAVKQGVVLISQKLNDLLRSKGVSMIESLDKELDTDLHEAVAKIPATDQDKKGKIIDVVQKGYKLKDKVIRHAKVVVGE